MQQNRRYKLLKVLTLCGCFATGIIYAAIGVIALLSFFRLKEGGADENSFFVLLNSFVLGKIVNWVIILGAVCFIVWRFYEAFKDPNCIGSDAKAILLRGGAAFSSVADAFIVLSVLQALFAGDKAPVTGEPVQQQKMVADLLQSNWGHFIVMATGIIAMLTAGILVFYGLSKRFTEAINADHFTNRSRHILHAIAYAGYFARGVILGIIGFFLLKASIKKNSSYVVNTDKAFDFIGDHVGHIWFILVALGTICYGIYMFVLGLHYDISAVKK